MHKHKFLFVHPRQIFIFAKPQLVSNVSKVPGMKLQEVFQLEESYRAFKILYRPTTRQTGNRAASKFRQVTVFAMFAVRYSNRFH